MRKGLVIATIALALTCVASPSLAQAQAPFPSLVVSNRGQSEQTAGTGCQTVMNGPQPTRTCSIGTLGARGKSIFFLPGDEVALAFNLKTQSVGVRIEREQHPMAPMQLSARPLDNTERRFAVTVPAGYPTSRLAVTSLYNDPAYQTSGDASFYAALDEPRPRPLKPLATSRQAKGSRSIRTKVSGELQKLPVAGCSGKLIRVRLQLGKRVVKTARVRVRGNCRYARTLTFSTAKLPRRYQPTDRKLTLRVHTSTDGRAGPVKRVRVRR